ncbi:hypothetical protein [Azospirillum sp. SYSU D00513]|uniref:hypothetical protein n=1 Tax=Azospirillum sp. SYSU D00513 TaxID=2812561 RepID=UPI001A959674|nr:hypothetical protein [Azospirillum sp. SYSU D00513]
MVYSTISEATNAVEASILTYRNVRFLLEEASGHASSISLKQASLSRREAFQQLREIGQQRAQSERSLRQTALAARRVLTPEAIEAIALRHDGKESDDSALTIIRTVLFRNGRL